MTLNTGNDRSST